MKIRPLNDRILVKRLEGEEKTAGGIIIPDSAKEKPAEGEVVEIRPKEIRMRQTHLRENDRKRASRAA